MRRRRQAIVLSVSAVFAILCPVVDGQLGIAIGLAPSAKYQTSYEPVYYTQTRKPAPVVKAVRAGIKLAGDVSSRIRTGIGQRVQALRNVLRVPPEKHIHHHPSSYSNSYSVDTYSPAPAYTSVVNSYDAPIVDSGYDSILLEEDHASNFELNAPQPVPPPENFPANIEGGTGDETPFTPILKHEEVILLDEFSAPASQTEITKEVIQLKRVDQEDDKMSIEEKKRAAMELRQRIRNKNKYYDPRGAVVTKDDLRRRPLVFMDIEVDGAAVGTIFIELFNETVPITAENFRLLATGELGFGYKGTIFHRIIPGFVMQGGDVTKKTTGDGQMSVYGPSFEDENFVVKHDSLGLLSMANEGPDTNGSQFFFTLAPALKMLDGRHVVFGRIYNEESYRLIERISEIAGTESGVTKAEVKIFNCGEYHNKKTVDTT